MKSLKTSLFIVVVLMCFAGAASADLELNYLERHATAIRAHFGMPEHTIIVEESSGESGLFNEEVETGSYLNGSYARAFHHSTVENTGSHLSIIGTFEINLNYPNSVIVNPVPQAIAGLTVFFSCTEPINYSLEIQACGFREKNIELFRVDGGVECFEEFCFCSGQNSCSGQLPGPGVYGIKMEYEALLVPSEFCDEAGTLHFIFEVIEESAVTTSNETWDQVKALFK